jgi:hypothetical protein
MLQAMFVGRRLRVRFRGHTTKPVTLEVGGHQGGVIVPFAWTVLMDPLAKRLGPAQRAGLGKASGKANLLADDITLCSTHTNPALARASVNAQLAVIRHWTREEGIAINCSKCDALILSGTFRSATGDWLLPLELNGPLPVRRGALRLNGLWIDTALSMTHHARMLQVACIPLLERLKSLSRRLLVSARAIDLSCEEKVRPFLHC